MSSSGDPLVAKERRPYTAGEELANWLTHAVGVVASVVG